MSIVGQPPARPIVVLLAGLIAVLGSLPTGSARAATPLAGDPAGPSIQYEEWLAHAGDRIDFEPGGRLSVGFRPRSGDQGIVGGQPARALPAGRASGEEMAAP